MRERNNIDRVKTSDRSERCRDTQLVSELRPSKLPYMRIIVGREQNPKQPLFPLAIIHDDPY